MAQESIYKNIAIIGAGASGGMAAILLSKNPFNSICLFDLKEPFSTLLPTGGGRCNITNAQDDIYEFVKNYPRGEKFLLSVFHKFDNSKTRILFKDLGINSYIQQDGRVFPVNNSSEKTVKILSEHLKSSNISIKKEKVILIKKDEDKFSLETSNGSKYCFDAVILATGGKGNGFELANKLGHNIKELKPSLCALDVKEKSLYKLAGLSFKSVDAKIKKDKKYISCSGDFLFTHKSISGPCVFKISALSAYQDFNDNNPMEVIFNFTGRNPDEIEAEIKNNSKKTIKNTFSKYVPDSFISAVSDLYNIDVTKQTAQLKKQEKEQLINALTAFRLHAVNRIKNSEIVTAGGIDLKEVNPKTMESKLVKNLYFAGEILDIDGFTGGYNLQNCWSTAYIISLFL